MVLKRSEQSTSSSETIVITSITTLLIKNFDIDATFPDFFAIQVTCSFNSKTMWPNKLKLCTEIIMLFIKIIKTTILFLEYEHRGFELYLQNRCILLFIYNFIIPILRLHMVLNKVLLKKLLHKKVNGIHQLIKSG